MFPKMFPMFPKNEHNVSKIEKRKIRKRREPTIIESKSINKNYKYSLESYRYKSTTEVEKIKKKLRI